MHQPCNDCTFLFHYSSNSNCSRGFSLNFPENLNTFSCLLEYYMIFHGWIYVAVCVPHIFPVRSNLSLNKLLFDEQKDYLLHNHLTKILVNISIILYLSLWHRCPCRRQWWDSASSSFSNIFIQRKYVTGEVEMYLLDLYSLARVCVCVCVLDVLTLILYHIQLIVIVFVYMTW